LAFAGKWHLWVSMIRFRYLRSLLLCRPRFVHQYRIPKCRR
jgi:hypothetical protein